MQCQNARFTVLSLAVILTAIIATGALDATAAESGNKSKKPPPAVSIEVIEPRLFEQRLALTGSIEPTRIAELSSPAEGPVQDCRIREGDEVAIGETLLAIGRKTSVTAEVIAAEEELERKQRDFDRFSSLADRNVLAADELDRARAELERARAGLALAKQTAADYVLRAPWSGVVSRVHVADGKYVAPRTPLVDLFDPASLVLRFQVPEAHVFAIEPGDEIEARFDAKPEQRFALVITRAYPEIDRRLRTRTFEAALPLEEITFAPGQFARISVALQRVPEAITAPVEAVVTGTDGQPQVFIVANDGSAQAVPVTIGAEQGGRVLLTAGPEAGERLIVNGVEKVKAGSPVRIAGDSAAGQSKPGAGEAPATTVEPSGAAGDDPPAAAGNGPSAKDNQR